MAIEIYNNPLLLLSSTCVKYPSDAIYQKYRIRNQMSLWYPVIISDNKVLIIRFRKSWYTMVHRLFLLHRAPRRIPSINPIPGFACLGQWNDIIRANTVLLHSNVSLLVTFSEVSWKMLPRDGSSFLRRRAKNRFGDEGPDKIKQGRNFHASWVLNLLNIPYACVCICAI